MTKKNRALTSQQIVKQELESIIFAYYRAIEAEPDTSKHPRILFDKLQEAHLVG
ncbi:MAG: hypothetical protein M3261_00020 [Thermoproteota archaeon]|nr:hypothetical protein [Thermoproteota archaeon]